MISPFKLMSALHFAITASFFSSICNKTAFLFREKNEFNTVKEKFEGNSTKQLLE